MRRDRTARDAAEALVTLPVPEVIVEVGTDEHSSVMIDTLGEVSFFSCCIYRYCLPVDNQTSPRQVCIICNCIAHLACSENLVFQNLVDMEFVVTVRDFTKAAKSRIRFIPKSQHGTIHFCIFEYPTSIFTIFLLNIPNVHSTSFRMLSSHLDQQISSISLVTVNGGQYTTIAIASNHCRQ